MFKQLLLISLLIFAFNACRAPTVMAPPYSPEVARVDDLVIKEEVLRFRYQLELDKFPAEYLKQKSKESHDPKAVYREILRDVLDKMIEDFSILAYGQKTHIDIPAQELADRFEKRKNQLNSKTLETLLEEKKIPYGRWKDLNENEIRVQYILEKALWPKLTVTPNEVSSYYQKNSKDYQVPPQVRARQIVTDSQAKADDIYERLLKGENFAKLAVDHSLSPDRAKGGDLGYFSKGSFPKVFDDTCFNLEIGQLSPVVKSEYGYHIFKVIDKKPQRTLSLTEVADGIQQELFEKKLKAAYSTWIVEVKTQVKVQIDESMLEQFIF